MQPLFLLLFAVKDAQFKRTPWVLALMPGKALQLLSEHENIFMFWKWFIFDKTLFNQTNCSVLNQATRTECKYESSSFLYQSWLSSVWDVYHTSFTDTILCFIQITLNHITCMQYIPSFLRDENLGRMGHFQTENSREKK